MKPQFSVLSLIAAIGASNVLGGCASPTYSAVKSPTRTTIKTPKSKLARDLSNSVAVRPKALDFLQVGLHNCGTIAMLVSWARWHPQEAANLVHRQPNGYYQVHFTGMGPVIVTPAELQQARKVQLVESQHGEHWAEVVLTAFTKLKSQPGHLNFKAIEWVYAGEIGSCLSQQPFGRFDIKPMSADARGMVQMGPAVSPAALDQQFRLLHGHPAVAYTNRCIHIWAILDYDAKRHLIHARNPRRTASVWMPLAAFRDKFQLLVYANG